MTQQPDVEIYIKNVVLDDLASWLAEVFSDTDIKLITNINLDSPKPVTTHISLNEQRIELMITPRAAGKAYTSIWFKSQNTPWKSDLECAHSALTRMDTEVRCSAESYTESEEEFSEKWWKLTRDSKELVVWA